MQKNKTRDFLIRGMPLEVYELLEKAALKHHRSKTQEAILALSAGLTVFENKIQEPIPFKWKKKPTSKFINDAVNEGRE